MKTLTLATLFVTLTLAGCSKSKLPSECVDMMNILNEVAQKSGQSLDEQKRMLEQMESSWDKMSDAEKDKTRQECTQGKALFEQLMNMGG